MPPPDVPYLRTPPSRFDNLPNFPYEPHYLQYGNLRMAYIDEKVGLGSETYLLLHGQPTWSFLYRKMIPVFLKHTTVEYPPARRIVAPDLFGFGRSDKPSDEATYTFNFHRDSLLHFVRTLDLTNITLVVQDWGGILGLTLPVAEPTRFKRLVVMNTAIPIGEALTKGFLDWRAFSNRSPDMKIGSMIARSCENLSPAEAAAYDAPYPDIKYKAGVRRFPNMVMTDKDMEGVDIAKESKRLYETSDIFKDPEDIFMACGQKDPVLGPPVMKGLAKMWKNGCYYTEIDEGGHFVQEWGNQVATLAIGVFEGRGDGLGGRVQKVSSDSRANL